MHASEAWDKSADEGPVLCARVFRLYIALVRPGLAQEGRQLRSLRRRPSPRAVRRLLARG